MILRDVVWTPSVNVLFVQCDCGVALEAPSSCSLVQCPRCLRAEYWHSFDPVGPVGRRFFSAEWVVMRQEIRP